MEIPFFSVSTYLLTDIAIVAVPLLLNLVRPFREYRKLKPLLLSILSVGGVYAIWDIIATARGHWEFNPAHILGPKLFGLPLEELLFFVVAPYSCLFVYESLGYFFGDRKVSGWNLKYIIPGLFTAFAFFEGLREYTLVAIAVTLIMTSIISRKDPALFESRNYWVYMGICTLFFILFNQLLAAIPIVTYSSRAIMDVRFLSIPLEDFLYNYSMLTLYLFAYRKFASA